MEALISLNAKLSHLLPGAVEAVLRDLPFPKVNLVIAVLILAFIVFGLVAASMAKGEGETAEKAIVDEEKEKAKQAKLKEFREKRKQQKAQKRKEMEEASKPPAPPVELKPLQKERSASPEQPLLQPVLPKEEAVVAPAPVPAAGLKTEEKTGKKGKQKGEPVPVSVVEARKEEGKPALVEKEPPKEGKKEGKKEEKKRDSKKKEEAKLEEKKVEEKKVEEKKVEEKKEELLKGDDSEFQTAVPKGKKRAAKGGKKQDDAKTESSAPIPAPVPAAPAEDEWQQSISRKAKRPARK